MQAWSARDRDRRPTKPKVTGRIQSGAFLRVPLRTGIWLGERECRSASQSPHPDHAAGLHASPADDRYITATFSGASGPGPGHQLHRDVDWLADQSQKGRKSLFKAQRHGEITL
jgi:hypothetical protein